MPGIKAIPTSFNGVLYASRLEANWAKTLHSWRVVAVPEPDLIRLPNGEGYLPDLFLKFPPTRTYLEVKGGHDARRHKPSLLAAATEHAPGCERGRPEARFDRPAGLPAASCACGFGPDFPYLLVVVTRSGEPATRRGLPASEAGYCAWESADPDAPGDLVLVTCPVRQRPFWMSTAHVPACRCCLQPLPPGTPAKRSGEVPFLTVPRTGGRRRKAA